MLSFLSHLNVYCIVIIGAMNDRIDDIRKGFMILLPVLDEKGRAIIYANPALMEDDKVEEVRTIIFMFIFLCKLLDSCLIEIELYLHIPTSRSFKYGGI